MKFNYDYASWATRHPKVASMVASVEGAAIGAAFDYMAHGFTLNRSGLHGLLVAVMGAVIVALRNYLRPSPKQAVAKLQFD